MLKKLWCKLFGHILFYKMFAGETTKITDRLTGEDITVPVQSLERSKACSRCGIMLDWEKIGKGE